MCANGIMPSQGGGGFNTVIQSLLPSALQLPVLRDARALPADAHDKQQTYQSYINSGWTNVEFTTGNYVRDSRHDPSGLGREQPEQHGVKHHRLGETSEWDRGTARPRSTWTSCQTT